MNGRRTEHGDRDERAARLAEALRANLQRRKAQARARREGAPDERPDGLGKETRQGKAGPTGS